MFGFMNLFRKVKVGCLYVLKDNSKDITLIRVLKVKKNSVYYFCIISYGVILKEQWYDSISLNKFLKNYEYFYGDK